MAKFPRGPVRAPEPYKSITTSNITTFNMEYLFFKVTRTVTSTPL
jgi:hypothetical protein